MSLPRPTSPENMFAGIAQLITELERRKLFQVTEGLDAAPEVFIKLGRKTANNDGGGNITVTYATPFPTATDYVFAVSANGGNNPVYRIGVVTASTFVAFFNVGVNAQDFYWLAIGH